MVSRLRASRLILLVLILGLLAAGCSLDTNEPFGYQIGNDSPVTVIIEDCKNAPCTRHNERIVLAPGTTSKQLGYASGDAQSWKVRSTSNRTLGCLPFRWHKRLTSDKSFPVSLKVPCGSTGGAATVGDDDWPPAS